MSEPVDVDAILASIPEVELADDPWGGANLEVLKPEDYEGVPLTRKRLGELARDWDAEMGRR